MMVVSSNACQFTFRLPTSSALLVSCMLQLSVFASTNSQKRQPPLIVEWASSLDVVSVSNQFLRFTLSTEITEGHPYSFGLVDVRSDFAGGWNFENKPNLLSRPVVSMVQWRHDYLPIPCLPSSDISLEKIESGVVVKVSFAAHDSRTGGSIASNWTIALEAESRALTFATHGGAHGIQGAYLSVDLAPLSITGRYSSGSVQMMNQDGWVGYRPSLDDLPQLLALSQRGSVEIWRTRPIRTVCGVAVHNDTTFIVSTPFNSGLREITVGELKGKAARKQDQWTAFEYGLPHESQHCSATFATSWQVFVNDLPFPSSTVAPYLWIDSGIEHSRVRAAALSIYGTVLGTLTTHNNSMAVGKHLHGIATGLLHPRRGYWNRFNFFDPDSYLAMQALLLLGDARVNEDVRGALELTGSHLCNASLAGGVRAHRRNESCTPNQLPHHFVKDQPVYVAISGERQTGPNVFWALTVLEFAKWSGDSDWLRSWLPTVRRAAAFLEWDDSGLVWAGGSLMIDTFVRRGFTLDTNAAVVRLLQELAAAEEWVGDASAAPRLRRRSERVKQQLNLRLWAGDHYVTSVDRDGWAVDFVDYDANLLAAAFGVADQRDACESVEGCPSRAERLLARMDADPRARRVLGWPSERLYQANWTQPSGGTPDAICGMGRIAWFGALARRRVRTAGARAVVEGHLATLQRDLTAQVWMPERYAPDGAPEADRTSHYFEFPAVMALLAFKVWYGIEVDERRVRVDPWGVESFDWFVGATQVRYQRFRRCELLLAQQRRRKLTVVVTGMAEAPGVLFLVRIACAPSDLSPEDKPEQFLVRTDRRGAVELEASLGPCGASGPAAGTAAQAHARYRQVSIGRVGGSDAEQAAA